MHMQRNLVLGLATALVLTLSACEGLNNKSGERALSGAAIGAGVGAGAGLLTGDVLSKTVGGAALGAAGGLAYDQYKKSKD
jgi:hypothetical protein